MVLLSGTFGGGDFDCVGRLVGLGFWLGAGMVLGELPPSPPVGGLRCIHKSVYNQKRP